VSAEAAYLYYENWQRLGVEQDLDDITERPVTAALLRADYLTLEHVDRLTPALEASFAHDLALLTGTPAVAAPGREQTPDVDARATADLPIGPVAP